jgi:fucose permease
MITSDRRRIQAVGYALFLAIGWASVLVPTLLVAVEQRYGQSDAALGLYFAATALVGAGGSFLGGLVTDRFGRRFVTPVITLLLGLSLVSQALAPSWELFFVAGVLANIGMGAVDGDVNGLFLDLHAEGQTGGALNRLHLFFSVGAVIGALLISQLVHWGSPWQATIGLTGLIITLLGLAVVRLPLPSGKHTHHDDPKPGAVNRSERSLLPFFGLAIAIGFYVASEIGVTNWVVKYVSATNVGIAALTLSAFWAGITLGRLLSSRWADRWPAAGFTIMCFVLSTASLAGAVLLPAGPAALLLYGLTGLFYGPIFPMLMVIGGRIYPHRLAVLSGSLGAASTVGATVYPGLMGLAAAQYGLGAGLLGAAMLGLPAALAVWGAVILARRQRPI